MASQGQPEVGELVALVAGADERSTRSRTRLARLLARLAAALALTGEGATTIGTVGGRWLVDAVPRLRIRDLGTLRAHHDGLSGEALADALVAAAAKATGAVGAGGGALAAVEYAAPPTLLSAPMQIAAETVAVVAIEVKLVAELHEVYGVRVPGSPGQRGTAYLSAWAARRGVDPRRVGTFPAVITGAARHQLRQRTVRRFARTASTMGPLLTGAVAGAALNRRETARLGAAIRDDLRKRVILG